MVFMPIPPRRFWQSFLEKPLAARRQKTHRGGHREVCRPWLEELETRTVPAVFNLASGGNLAAAINAADGNTDANNTILLGAGVYSVTNQVIQDTTNITQVKALTIIGQGQGATLLEADGTNRVFLIGGNSTDIEVAFQNLTIKGGVAHDGGSVGGTAALGGGLLIDGGDVTLSNVNVTGNMAKGASGGPGVAQPQGVGGTGSNGSAAYGGGIYLGSGSLSIVNSIIGNNQAIAGKGGKGGAGGGGRTGIIGGGKGGGGGDAAGGGIYDAGGDLTLNNAVVASNKAHGGQAGQGGTGGATSHSQGGKGGTGGAARGGGIYLSHGFLTLMSSKLSANQATAGTGGTGGFGGHTQFGGSNIGGAGGPGGIAQGGGLAMGKDEGLFAFGGGWATLFSSLLESNTATGGQGGAGAYLANGGPGGAAQGGGISTTDYSYLALVGTSLNSNSTLGGQGGALGPGIFYYFNAPALAGNGGAASGGARLRRTANYSPTRPKLELAYRCLRRLLL